jgi:integrase
MAVQHRPDRKMPWRVYWNNPHTGKRESKSFATEAEARKHDSLTLHRLQYEPEAFAGVGEQSAKALTVEGLVYLYLKDRDLKPSNLRFTLLHARSVLAEIGTIIVPELDQQDMRRVVAALKASGVKQNTINRRVSIIKAALNWGEDCGLIPANPIPRFSCPRGDDERIAPPTRAEIDAILAVAPERIVRMVLLGLALGVRVGGSEMFRLKWEDFDTERFTVRVWAADKNHKRPWRDLHLREDFVPVLIAWRADGADYVIHDQGKPVASLKTAWASTLAKAGITRRIRPYDLRHAFATYTLDSGADPKAVAEVMGHSGMAMIYKHYQHVLEHQRKAVMDIAPLPDLGTFAGHMKSPPWAHLVVPSTEKV